MTIDVKSPAGGAVGVVLINVGDVVKPGQSAFTVLEGAVGTGALSFVSFLSAPRRHTWQRPLLWREG